MFYVSSWIITSGQIYKHLLLLFLSVPLCVCNGYHPYGSDKFKASNPLINYLYPVTLTYKIQVEKKTLKSNFKAQYFRLKDFITMEWFYKGFKQK